MRTSLDLCFCLLTLCGITPVLYGVKVVVEEDSDAVLPCLISTEEDITGKTFDWKKDGQKDVFIYRSGFHSKNGLPDQDEQFKGRVSHFQDQLKNGNASIKIHNTKMADSGNYRCLFPLLELRQTFNIELVVGRILKDRSGETTGASPKPHITTLDQTKDWSLLQCEVRGASQEPKVEWQDSSGNILPAEEPQVSERGGRYYVTINTTVTKTGRYRCEATQEELYHQIHSETFVFINENPSTKVVIGLLFGGIVIGAALLVVVLALLVATKCITLTCIRAMTPPDMKLDDDRRVSEDRADSELTPSSICEWVMVSCDDPEMLSTTPHDMKLDDDRRVSVN
ncbi:butyrophilin subfamily 2 member A2-like [Sparus aurata]|uniref:butyrophilin subfamily 2 member A2-like n=1 Tax=Sparus aurata TaxID=8175 RepID=UPI0011C17EDF|nr:butyrophilin subfamily 2 member A2-like [Sparus aurata]